MHASRDAEPSSRRSVEILWLVAAVPSFWTICGYALIAGSDLWWHLAAGRWILAHGAIPTTDPFSFTAAGAPWWNHEWLADLVYAVWERTFGLASLVYWKWLLVVATFALLQRTLTRLTGDAATSFVCALGAAAVSAPFLDLRPHLYSFLAVVILLDATVERVRVPLWLPGLFLLWGNLHAGVTFGLVALGIVLAATWSRGAPAERRRALGVFVACAAAACANPTGIAPMLYALRYAVDVGSPYATIVEWRSPLAVGALRAPLFPYAVGALVAALLYARLALRERRVVSMPAVALSVLTLAMALRSARFVPLLAITATLVVAPVLAVVLRPLLARLPPRLLPVLVAVSFTLVLVLRRPIGPRAFGDLTLLPTFPVDSLSFAVANRLSGKVFTYYPWGGYVVLRSGGRLAVFIDGRADSMYPDAVFRDYEAIVKRSPDWMEIVARSGADYVLWPRTLEDHRKELLRSGRWRLLYADLVSVLLVRADGALPDPLVATPDSAYRALALGWDDLVAGDGAAAAAAFRRAEALDPSLTQACYLNALADRAVGTSEGSEKKGEGRACDATFPYQWYLADRLSFDRLPAALASRAATSDRDSSGRRSSGSRSP